MRSARPAPDQSLFPFVWSDPADDRPDRPADDLAVEDLDAPPPLRARVRARTSRPIARAAHFQRRHSFPRC
jgi:hypothetical protein